MTLMSERESILAGCLYKPGTYLEDYGEKQKNVIEVAYGNNTDGCTGKRQLRRLLELVN